MIEKQAVVKTEEPPEVEGINWTILKGHSISQPLGTDEEIDIITNKEIKWRLIGYEEGCGMSNTGNAVIICGEKGEKLRPFRIPKRGHLAGARHAYFTSYNPIIEITANHHRHDYSIRVYRYSINTKTGEVESKELWRIGADADASYNEVLESIPNKLEYLEEAIKASMDKASCWHCREPHYIKIKVE